QGQYSPVPVENQIAIIFCGTRGLLRDVPLNRVRDFEAEFLQFMNIKHKPVMDELKAGNLSKEAEEILEKVALDIAAKYK
ncbi:MAG TPA: F0F1 ATP synthase subunit alpha, partial [Bacteroidales bacterium]|nr:F0F1 ATP synthase subunit alpha [Bacteroidales bacterium]